MDLSDWQDTRERSNHAIISASGSDTTLVAAVTGKKIVVVSLFLYLDGDSALRFESGTGGTALTGVMQFYAQQGQAIDPGSSTANLILPFHPMGWMETGIGELLNLEMSNGALASGALQYVLE